jgi:type VI secretion system protein ImpH
VKSRSAYARLLKEPRRFTFDAAVRVLAWAAGRRRAGEVARYRSAPGLAFPTAEVMAVRPAEGGQPPEVTVGMMGLTGAAGVMPRLYTELLNTSIRERSRSMHEFLDLLAHASIGLFADAGTKYRLHRAAEQTGEERQQEGKLDPISGSLLALTGYATPHLVTRFAAGTDALLHYAGLFSMRPRSVERLRALVSDWLGRPVEIEQFAGAWLALAPDQRTVLAVAPRQGAWNSLGIDAAIGVRSWDAQARLILHIGPLDRAGFESLLPDRPGLRRLVSLVRAFLGFETGFAINPILAADEVPPLCLNAAPDPPPRLGWNSWMPAPSRPLPRDASDAIFEAEIVEANETTLRA